MKTAYLIFMIPVMAFAQGKGGPGGKRDERFAERKASIQKRVSEEKAALDSFSSCVGSAQNGEELRKCEDSRETAMKKIREEMRDERRKHLQDELKKLDSPEGEEHH